MDGWMSAADNNTSYTLLGTTSKKTSYIYNMM